MKIIKQILILLLALQLTGCNTRKNHGTRATPLVMFKDLKKSAYTLDYDASRRGSIVYIDYESGKVNIISEPPPDAIVSAVSELASSFKYKEDVDASFTQKLTETISDLSKKTNSDNILRDALYRINEYKLNFETFDKESVQLYMEALSVAREIATTEGKKIENQIIENRIKEEELKKENNTNTISEVEEWFIIVGGDSTVESAKDELKKAIKINPNSKIIKKGNSYRTVMCGYSNKEDLKEDFNTANTIFSSSKPYVVKRFSWCDNIKDGEEFSTCE